MYLVRSLRTVREGNLFNQGKERGSECSCTGCFSRNFNLKKSTCHVGIFGGGLPPSPSGTWRVFGIQVEGVGKDDVQGMLRAQLTAQTPSQ